MTVRVASDAMRTKLSARAGVLPWVWNHPSNAGSRPAAVARAVSFQLRGRVLGRPTVGTIGRSARFIADVGSSAASKALYANPPDHPEMLVWRQRLQPGDLFVDVGANVGTYTLWAADLGAEVIAVEPGAWALDRLRRNLALNDFKVQVVEAVATDHEGVEQFDPSGDSTAHIGEGIEVAATTLDAVLGDRTAAGMKVDVEGAERLVLEGAKRALSEQRIACLQLEWNDLSESTLSENRARVTALLEDYGYRLYRPDDAGRLVPVDDPSYGPDVFALPRRP